MKKTVDIDKMIYTEKVIDGNLDIVLNFPNDKKEVFEYGDKELMTALTDTLRNFFSSWLKYYAVEPQTEETPKVAKIKSKLKKKRKKVNA